MRNGTWLFVSLFGSPLTSVKVFVEENLTPTVLSRGFGFRDH